MDMLTTTTSAAYPGSVARRSHGATIEVAALHFFGGVASLGMPCTSPRSSDEASEYDSTRSQK